MDITNIIQKHPHKIMQKGKRIHFVWIPGHIDVPGNEMAYKEEALIAATSEQTET